MTRRRLKLSEKTIKHEMVNIHWYDDWIERGEKREKMGFYGKVRENKIDSWY